VLISKLDKVYFIKLILLSNSLYYTYSNSNKYLTLFNFTYQRINIELLFIYLFILIHDILEKEYVYVITYVHGFLYATFTILI